MKSKGSPVGAILVIISTAIAILSLFLPWVDLGILSASGFQQQGFIFLVLFIYPFCVSLIRCRMIKPIAIICSILSIIAGVAFCLSKSANLLDTNINASGSGLYVFIGASILLLIGCIAYSNPINKNVKKTVKRKKRPTNNHKRKRPSNTKGTVNTKKNHNHTV
ncbi:hypothetical protein [Clostridium oceanicum]|uniref:Uncharacterized protein n=1 Tax=Clostridium oceanicum TaxID=1543 RepID=A0ABP3UMY3_9CLOT